VSERELKPSVERATSAHGGADLAHALGRFAARAEAERLVDVAFAIADSPLGPLLVAATERGVVRLAYLDENVAREDVLEELARRISPRVVEAPARLDEPRRQLDDYFGGRRAGFDVPVDLALVAPFAERVLGRTAAIPPGAVLTYGEVAAAIGSPRAAPGGRQRARLEPGADRRPLPSRGPGGRRARRLHRRYASQGAPARARARRRPLGGRGPLSEAASRPRTGAAAQPAASWSPALPLARNPYGTRVSSWVSSTRSIRPYSIASSGVK
jgi:methylated-DNA-[protein]-cysteine S-methyltransferase